MISQHMDDCTGCGGCAAICPKSCITMIADKEGFLYPQVQQSDCINCNLCEKVCPLLKRPALSKRTQALAAQNQDSSVRSTSSSGGVFTALAELVLREGGAVCAAVYGEDFSVQHKIAVTSDDIASMRGAKYAQSNIGQLYPELKELLDEDQSVLFVGTPCQCAGLKAYLGKDYSKLLLVDMICHGVPSPAVWHAYLQWRKKKDASGSAIDTVNLRSKSTGWSRYAYSVNITYLNGCAYSVPQGEDPFMSGFAQNLYLRPSCSNCAFKGVERCSDLTLGDCWGIWDSHPEFDDNKGTSLVLIQSQKGQQMWNKIRSNFRFIALKDEDAISCNPSAVSSSSPHPARAEFFARLSEGEPMDELIWDQLLPKPSKKSLIKRCIGWIFR